jgi:hypothetical protein
MSLNLADMMGDLLKGISPNPPRSIDALPGLRWKTVFDRLSLVPLLIVPIFLLLPIMILFSIPNMRLQFKHKAHVQGVVTMVNNPSADGQPRRMLDYSFETMAHQHYRGEQTVHEHSPYFSVQVGDPVPIVYAENQPSLNDIDGASGQDDPPLAIFAILPFFFFVFFIVFVAPMLLPNLQLLMQARKVFKRGMIVDAEIVFIKKRANANGFHPRSSKCEIYYSYKTSRGQLVESKTTCDNDWLVNKFDVGSPIHIAYLENQPQKSMILEAFIR